MASASPPVITAKLFGTAGQGGWFTSDVTVNWDIQPPGYTSTGCEGVTIDAETKGTKVTCSATIGDESSLSTAVVRIDKTPPQALVATPDRNPDRNGWYVHPLTVTYSATDPVSGLGSCTMVTYAGPDGGDASVSGTCRDAAGNVSAALPFAFRYDATPPAPAAVISVPGDASATLSWTPSADTTRVQLTRSPGVGGAPSTVIYTGTERSFNDSKLTNGIDYHYTLTAFDDAGNSADSATVVTPAAPPIVTLASKTANRRLSKPPQLRWKPVRGADYYNVQIFRGGRKILSAWPRHARMRVHTSWLYRGTHRRLAAGHYTWYVWPGYGKLGARRYGRLLGKNRFAIVPPG
ncbi:MAG TPA: fibronectin type III domain-containing protein [Solirubrobacteraceae bacterium]